MRDARELDTGNVARGALLSGEIPNRLVRIGEAVGQEPAAVGLREYPGVPPALTGDVADLLWHRTEIEDVDDEQVAGLGTFDVNRPGQHVRVGQVDVAYVVGGVVVTDLAVGPLAALDPDRLARANGDSRRDGGVPPVVAGHGLIAHRAGLVDGEDDVWHDDLQFQGRGSRAWRGSVVIGVARRERPGTDETTCGASALRASASRARRRLGSSTRRAGARNTRDDASPQPGHGAVVPACDIGRTRSKPPQARHR